MVWFITKNQDEFKELTDQLYFSGFPSKYYSTVSEALNNLLMEMPKGIIVDADHTEISCFEFCWMIKHAPDYKKIKFFILSGNQIESVEMAAFDSGADEFILKPLKQNAVLKRIVSRLTDSTESNVLNCQIKGKHMLQIDKEAFSVYFNNINVILSRKEFELLYFIASQPGKVFTRTEIFLKVWKKKLNDKDRTIDVHVLRIRKKLGEEVISTHKGIGYRLSI